MNAEDTEFIMAEHYNGEYVDGFDMECHCPDCTSSEIDYWYDRMRDGE